MRFTLDAGPLARCQCPEGPATDHFDTGFLSLFPYVLKANDEVVPKISKMSLHASHVAPSDVNVNFSSAVSSTCICV
jgi:hypothetical protein